MKPVTFNHVDRSALLCALVLVPGSYARNRFFELYRDPGALKVRRRAARLRGMIRQVVGNARARAEIVGEQILDDGQVLIRYRVGAMAFQRTVALSAMEAAVFRYALHRAGLSELNEQDRGLVESALERLDGRGRVETARA